MSQPSTEDHGDTAPDPDDVEASESGQDGADERTTSESDQPAEPAEPAAPAEPAEPAEQTGNPEVDSVIESLDDLDRRPVSEHVEVFESAHERLRGALSDAGDDPSRS